ncbi:DUF916 and DUF3324 domain-containing protein [Ligilactobacillus saerimneri]|uniref:DUF916 and DUF3324 domain-containing protein n=1 Tax=Ligilactobacillus saerimneri TaxID=228229 RepID=UPI003F25579C
MKVKTFTQVILTLVLGFCFLQKPAVQATVANDAAQFTISPVYPREQRPDTTGYFALKTRPKTTVPVKVKITNLNSDTNVDYIVRVGNATTTDNGAINYTDFKTKKDPTAAFQLTQFVPKKERTQQVTVAAHKSTTVSINLRLPRQKFNGTIAGGIYVERMTNAHVDTKSKLSAQNHFAMTLPVLVSQQKHPDQVAQMKLKAVKVQKGPKISATLRNTRPVLFGKLKINAQITKQGQTKVLAQRQVQNYQVAPNSTFNFLVTDHNQLGAGKYTLTLHLQSGKRKWNLRQNFTITGSQGVPFAKQKGWLGLSQLIWLLIGFLVLLIVILCGIIIAQNKRLNKKNK